MKRYETLFIVQVDLPDDELNSLIERYETIVTSFKGIIVKIEKWGKRKLAYEIKKQTNGFYVMIDFVGKRAVIEELERNFKIDDKILKFMTIMKDDKPDLAKIEKEKQDELRIEAPHAAPATERQIPADKTEVDEDKHSTSS
ncbi:MAG TPA: 30S ribosomal protein S6 [Syntrophales bacterium]|nr:30S ribosomal protein S6 [Syntrophales bacterium]